MTDKYVSFDNMCWPLPNGDLQWQLRYGSGLLNDIDKIRVATILSAYHALVLEKTQKDRNYICEKIKEAYKA